MGSRPGPRKEGQTVLKSLPVDQLILLELPSDKVASAGGSVSGETV
jgi:hypothetical protein